MKKDLLMALALTLFTAFVFRNAFFNFFTQDDFILINQFSGGGIAQDITNSFAYPAVTHWRPLHSLYFLISGNIFGRNYVLYHLLTFGFHLLCGLMIFKISQVIFRQKSLAILSAFFYLISPLHFVSLFWISGAATTIGFLLFSFSFYSHLRKKEFLAVCIFLLSLTASEGMVAGLAVFYAWPFLVKKSKASLGFLAKITLASAAFLVIRYLFFTPKITFDVYGLELSKNTLTAFQYYLLRILGFGENSGDIFPSLLLLVFLAILILEIFKKVRSENLRLYLFFLAIVAAGLFPFVLIPSHLSPHYMNISAFGFSMIAALALAKQKQIVQIILAGIFLVSSFLTISNTQSDNWVIQRSNISKHYLKEIERISPPEGSTLIFQDNNFSTSKEAYISLGTGEALRFWFKDKNYRGCFSSFEICESGQNSILVN